METESKQGSQMEVEDHTIDSVKILAWDYSYSTNKESHYHRHGKKYLDDFCNSYDCKDGQKKPIYLTWSDECSPVTLKDLRNICQLQEGTEGTYPSTIISWIQHHIPKEQSIELWLITDGQIGCEELQVCSLMNVGIVFSRINFIVISKDRINMSVGASFFRGAELRIFYNDSLYKQIDISKQFDYDSLSMDNFDSEWSNLSDFIQAKFMACDLESLQEVDKLSALRRRLLDSVGIENDAVSSKLPKFSSTKRADLIAFFKSCRFYQDLISTETRNKREMIEAKINALIDHIHKQEKTYDFDILKVDYKQAKIDSVKDESEPNLQNLDDLEQCTLYDAVTLDDEKSVPVLLLPVIDLIQKYWVDGNFSKFRTVMDCPLMATIDNYVGHVYTYSTFKSLYNSHKRKLRNPMTNEIVFGGLIFDKAADKWNDYVLTKSFFNGKKVNTCLALWYYVIWENAKDKPWIEPAVTDLLWNYALRRMQQAKVRIAFSKLPLDPKEMVPLSVACFYCTEGSSLLFGETANLFLHERLRQYWSVAERMVHILSSFGYEINKEFIMKRAKLFEVLNDLKKIPQEIEKKKFLLEKAFESKGPFLTYAIKDKTALPLLHVLKYHHNTSIIPFDFDAHPSDPRSLLVTSYDTELVAMPVLCPMTYRPYFVVKSDADDLVPNYNQMLDSIKEVTLGSDGEILNRCAVTTLDQKKIVPCCKLFIDLTKRLKRFPTIDEYTDYIWKVKRFLKNKVRLFCPQIMIEIQNYFNLYSKLKVESKVFIETTEKSVAILDRIKLERPLMEQHMEEFIKKAKDMLVKPKDHGVEKEDGDDLYKCPPRSQIKRIKRTGQPSVNRRLKNKKTVGRKGRKWRRVNRIRFN